MKFGVGRLKFLLSCPDRVRKIFFMIEMKSNQINISEETIKSVVNELNRLEFKGNLTVDRVMSDENVFSLIFNKQTVSRLKRGEVLELWNNDYFHDLAELLGAENQ